MRAIFGRVGARLKTLRNIFGNLWVLLGVAAYGVSFAILWRNQSFAPEDALSLLVIFGLAFPLLAWVTTLRARPLTLTIQRSAAEMWLLFACLIGVTLYLVWGTALSEALVPAKLAGFGTREVLRRCLLGN